MKLRYPTEKKEETPFECLKAGAPFKHGGTRYLKIYPITTVTPDRLLNAVRSDGYSIEFKNDCMVTPTYDEWLVRDREED